MTLLKQIKHATNETYAHSKKKPVTNKKNSTAEVILASKKDKYTTKHTLSKWNNV